MRTTSSEVSRLNPREASSINGGRSHSEGEREIDKHDGGFYMILTVVVELLGMAVAATSSKNNKS